MTYREKLIESLTKAGFERGYNEDMYYKDLNDEEVTIRVMFGAYADFEENEGDIWEFDNEIEPCYGIPLDEVREQVEAVTEITAEFDYLHEFQQYLRVTGQREEANKIKL